MKSPELLETVDVQMRNGVIAGLRPVIPADIGLFEEGLAELSSSSRFARFGVGLDHLSNQELRYLTDVDQTTHVAIGATVGGNAAGVGRYVVIPDEGCAEAALTVVDRYQRQGLGRALFAALTAVARHDGVGAFCFEVTPGNDQVDNILRRMAAEIGEAGFIDGRVDVSRLPQGDRDDEHVALMELHRSIRRR